MTIRARIASLLGCVPAQDYEQLSVKAQIEIGELRSERDHLASKLALTDSYVRHLHDLESDLRIGLSIAEVRAEEADARAEDLARTIEKLASRLDETAAAETRATRLGTAFNRLWVRRDAYLIRLRERDEQLLGILELQRAGVKVVPQELRDRIERCGVLPFRPRLAAPAAEVRDVVVHDRVSQETWTIARLWLENGEKKWALSRGGDDSLQISVSVRDREFLSRVERREILFGCGDCVTVDLRTIGKRRGTEPVRSTFIVERVVAFIPCNAEQMSFPAPETAAPAINN